MMVLLQSLLINLNGGVKVNSGLFILFRLVLGHINVKSNWAS